MLNTRGVKRSRQSKTKELDNMDLARTNSWSPLRQAQTLNMDQIVLLAKQS